MNTATRSPNPSPWHILSAVAGWLLPGLGHLLIGEKHRAAILAVTIGGLWLAGTLTAGVTIFDTREHRMWFLGQMLAAPSVVGLYVHNSLHSRYGTPMPTDDHPVYSPAYGRTQEQGLLYTSLAGMLNLLAMIDVLYRDPRKARLRNLLETEPMGEAGA